MPYYQINNKQTGAVLIISLLFLSLLTLLIMAALQSSKMQFIMARHYQEHTRAVKAANLAMLQAVQLLSANIIEKTGAINNGDYHIKLIRLGECENYYSISTQGKFVNAKATLDAEYAVPNAECIGENKLLWWREN